MVQIIQQIILMKSKHILHQQCLILRAPQDAPAVLIFNQIYEVSVPLGADEGGWGEESKVMGLEDTGLTPDLYALGPCI